MFVVSLIFYGWGEPIYIGIMLISTIVDYYNGWMIAKNRTDKKKALCYVIFSVIFNLSILGFFKYYDFLAVSLNSLFQVNWFMPLGLSLPIGISFYTFQTMSYPIDVYRNDAEPQKNIFDFGTYVTLFPQLIAGPIVRYKDLAQQLVSRTVTSDLFASGISRFVQGLAKKVLLANNIGVIFDTISVLDSSRMSVGLAWIGLVAFAFQIYFDFSGYSDMAIGLGRMFGFQLPENFNYPYLAKSITDFWRRWHISLGSWFRDYLYFPLGGSRKGKGKTLRNLAIVWFCTGLWHGASWNFIGWGLYFGILIIIEKLGLLAWLKQRPAFLQHGYALFFIMAGWLLFAFTDLSQGLEFGKMMLGLGNIPLWNQEALFYVRNYGFLFLIAAVASTPLAKKLFVKTEWDWLVPVLCTAGFLLCIAYLVDASYNPFLYFRF